jgi:hypothetical protein
LPVTLEEIDPAWLTAALGAHAPPGGVRSVEVVDAIRGTCTKLRLRLGFDGSSRDAGRLPDTVILKGGFEPHSREMHFIHEQEVRGYREVFPSLGLHTPACYFGDYDPESRQGIVIMEDLVQRGVTFCNPLKPQTHDQVARRLTALARFHARTWDNSDLSSGKWSGLTSPAVEAPIYFAQYLEPDVWAHYVGLPRGAAASTHFHDRHWMARALAQLEALSSTLPYCVIHSDTHLGNLYVEPDGTPGFYDGMPGRAPAIMEVSYHVVGALDPMDCRRWDRALIRHYLDELERCGVMAPDFDEFMRQYAAFLAYGYCVFLINKSVFQPEAINTAYTARFSSAMINHNTLEVLETIV